MELMRPRTKNEKILLAILAAIVFGSGNYFGYQWLAKKQSGLQLADAQLKADQAEAKVDLLEADKWAARKAWVSQHEPALGNEDDAKAKVLDFVLKGAHDNKLEVTDPRLQEAEQGAAGTCINVSLKVKGSMKDLCQWMTDLEKPEQFYAISSFSLKADQDQKSMVCTLQIARYFKDKEGS
jgi:hypothetical protein